MIDKMEYGLYATLDYNYCIVVVMVVTLLFLNDCVPILALRMRYVVVLLWSAGGVTPPLHQLTLLFLSMVLGPIFSKHLGE